MSIRLSETQKRIVQHGDGPLLVVAGPGTGKTRVLTERVRRLLTEGKGHFRVLALTFTNKAANEMKERLSEFPDIHKRAFIGTLHSFCVEVLANRGKTVGIETSPVIFESYQDRKQVLLQAVMEDPKLSQTLRSRGDARDQDKLLNNWLEQIGAAKNSLQTPELVSDQILRKAYEAYDENLRASNALDFDDLLLFTYQLFVERPKIADFYRRQYRYICIDEAQDLNEAQYQVIRALCGSKYRNIMMVGDPKQAIFVWNGASPKYLDLFQRDFGAKKIAMHDNFRSSQAVVKAAQALVSSYEVEGNLPIDGDLNLIIGETEKQEAELVLNYIEDLVSHGHPDIEGPVTLERCVLLGRTRYVLSAVEGELNARGWPYFRQLSPQHQTESDLFADFELCLRILANPQDLLHRGILLKRWRLEEWDFSLSQANNGLKILDAIGARATSPEKKAVLRAVHAMEWREHNFKFVAALNELDAYAANLENEERALIMQDAEVWRKHWDSFIRSRRGGSHNLLSFLSDVALGTTQQPRGDGLALLTIHSAKGTEFDVVVIMGMAEGVFPDYRAKRSPEALEEEKRNAFVAITRSKRLVSFSYSRNRVMPWGETRQQNPSRYLREIGIT